MDTFGNDPGRRRRQAVDGVIHGAPSRQQLGGQPLGRRNLNGDVFRTNTARTIGDFNRANGYHAANNQVASPLNTRKPSASSKPADGLLLNMELPGDEQATSKGRRHSQHKAKKHGRVRRIIGGSWKAVSLRSALVVLALLLVIGGFLFVKGYIKLHKVFKGGGSAVALQAKVDPSYLKTEGDSRVNVLIMGIGGAGHDGGDLTDTMLVASIDPVNNKAALFSVPRDLWVTTSSAGSSKINAVFAFAKEKAQNQGKNVRDATAVGAAAAEAEVQKIFGIHLNYYTVVDFEAFEQAVNTVGGVDINITPQLAVSEYVWDEVSRTHYYLNVTPGMQHFNGQRALYFTRSRHTSARGDFDRTERQRAFLEALSQKITSVDTYANPVKLSQLMDAFGDHIQTDISVGDALKLMKIGKGIGGNFDSLDFADPTHPLVKTGMISGQSVVLPVAGLTNFSQLQAYVRSHLPDGYIIKENANITVLNGSGVATLAQTKADELKSYGYNVGTVGDAPTHSYGKTVLVDLTKGKDPYTQNYLEKRLGVKATTKLPDSSITPGNANFVIILGSDETPNR